MEPVAVRTDRTLIVILAVIVAIVVVALVVVFTRGGSPNVDPSTPEGVVQSYTNAVVASEYSSAKEFLTADIRDNCDRADPGSLRDLRMTVISTSIDGDTAVVRVTVERGSGTYGGSGYQSEDSFSLVQEGDLWKIESTPWDVTLCYDQGAEG